jgi:hypothetical protein
VRRTSRPMAPTSRRQRKQRPVQGRMRTSQALDPHIRCRSLILERTLEPQPEPGRAAPATAAKPTTPRPGDSSAQHRPGLQPSLSRMARVRVASRTFTPLSPPLRALPCLRPATRGPQRRASVNGVQSRARASGPGRRPVAAPRGSSPSQASPGPCCPIPRQ